ncbi:MAG: hypothetical protein AAF683_01345 [Pseudomonadota bacterium]
MQSIFCFREVNVGVALKSVCVALLLGACASPHRLDNARVFRAGVEPIQAWWSNVGSHHDYEVHALGDAYYSSALEASSVISVWYQLNSLASERKEHSAQTPFRQKSAELWGKYYSSAELAASERLRSAILKSALGLLLLVVERDQLVREQTRLNLLAQRVRTVLSFMRTQTDFFDAADVNRVNAEAQRILGELSSLDASISSIEFDACRTYRLCEDAELLAVAMADRPSLSELSTLQTGIYSIELEMLQKEIAATNLRRDRELFYHSWNDDGEAARVLGIEVVLAEFEHAERAIIQEVSTIEINEMRLRRLHDGIVERAMIFGQQDSELRRLIEQLRSGESILDEVLWAIRTLTDQSVMNSKDKARFFQMVLAASLPSRSVDVERFKRY